MDEPNPTGFAVNRRNVLRFGAALILVGGAARVAWAQLARIFPGATDLSAHAVPNPGQGGFLTAGERRTVSAVFDRLIPADDLSPSASECGCVEFLDRQLSGAYGRASAMYRAGPFVPGTVEQGWQHPATPAERYRSGLAAIDRYAREQDGLGFAELAAARQDAVLREIEAGTAKLGGNTDAKAFFALMLATVREGFLSDPMYGGNKNMAGWRMTGFPGVRYDFRDTIDKAGQKLSYQPVSLLDPARNT